MEKMEDARYKQLFIPLVIDLATLTEMDQAKYPEPTGFVIPAGFTPDYFLKSSMEIINHLQKNDMRMAQDFIHGEEENASRMLILVNFCVENFTYTALVLSVVNKKISYDEAKKFLSSPD